MNSIFLVLLSMSVSGSILILLLLALKPIIKGRFSQTWQYYIWLIIILRFLLPVTAEVNFMDSAVKYIESGIKATEQTSGQVVPKAEAGATSDGETWPHTSQTKVDAVIPAVQDVGKVIQDNIWLIWAAGMLMMLFYKVISYNAFVRFVKIRAEAVTDSVILDLYQAELIFAKVNRKIPLKINDRLGSPMLVGIIRPILVIPSLETNTDNLRYIFRHELTHYRRRDVLYKWLVQITKCVHWFNPLVYMIGKQIDQGCELSCDEVIIKHLDHAARGGYGDALIASLKSQENYSEFVISITMSDNKKRLKERLDAIMKLKKTTRLNVAISIILAFALSVGATVVGAYAATPSVQEPVQSDQQAIVNGSIATTDLSNSRVIREGGVYFILCDGADESDKPHSGVTEGSILFVLVRKDGYTSIGPFNDLKKLVNEVTEQCDSMMKKQFITQAETKLIIEIAAKIQSGNENEFKDFSKETSHVGEYAEWEIKKKSGAYYYKNERLRIFMDLRADNSVVTYNYDKLGTTNLRLIREQNGNIIKAEYLTEAETMIY